MDLLNRVVELARGNRGLDAGCGAGARDVHLLYTWGYDIYGIDAVEENISLGRELHPEIANKLSVADLREPLSFESGFFDFVLCNAVIQHLTPEATETTAIPELARVLTTGGVLQLMFKTGSGVATVSDRAYGEDGQVIGRRPGLDAERERREQPTQTGQRSRSWAASPTRGGRDEHAPAIEGEKNYITQQGESNHPVEETHNPRDHRDHIRDRGHPDGSHDSPGAERRRPQPRALQRQSRRADHLLGRPRPGPVGLPDCLGQTGPRIPLVQGSQRGQPGERIPERNRDINHANRAGKGRDLQGPNARPVHQRRTEQPPLERAVDGHHNGPGQGRPARTAPTGVTADASHNSVTLSWTAPSQGTVTGYRVLRGTETGNLSPIVQDTGNTSTEYTDSTVAAETTYHYAVLALSQDGDGARSAAVSGHHLSRASAGPIRAHRPRRSPIP